MCCTVVFCWIFILFETLPTDTSKARRIIGGRDADETKYQYVVRLRAVIINTAKKILGNHHRCTAAILAPTWALTAGHCSETEDLEALIESENETFMHIIIYGSLNTLNGSIVLDIIKHPAYKFNSYLLINDVALIRHSPITLNQYARLSGLDYVTMIGQEVTLVGYGTTNGTLTINGTLTHVAIDATKLRKPLQLSDAVLLQCSEDLKRVLMPGMCLARRCNKLAALCPGDSGGPVLHESGVVGISSIGPQQVLAFCDLKPYTTFYDPGSVTPTSLYIDWISSVIKKEVPMH